MLRSNAFMLATNNMVAIALAVWVASLFLPLFGSGEDVIYGWALLWLAFDPIGLIILLLSPWVFLSFLTNVLFMVQAYLMVKGGRGSTWMLMACISFNAVIVIEKPSTQLFKNIGIPESAFTDLNFGPAAWVWLLSFVILLIAASRDAGAREA